MPWRERLNIQHRLPTCLALVARRWYTFVVTTYSAKAHSQDAPDENYASRQAAAIITGQQYCGEEQQASAEEKDMSQ